MGWARHSEHLHARFHGFHTTSPSQGTYVHGTGTAARVAVVMTVETNVIEATSSVASSADSQRKPSSPSINQSIGSSSSSTGDVGARHGTCTIEANGGASSLL